MRSARTFLYSARFSSVTSREPSSCPSALCIRARRTGSGPAFRWSACALPLASGAKISKISSKAAATALAGAHFRICTNGTDGGAFTTCTAAKTGSDDLDTGTATFVCVDNLTFGDYYVSEKSPPTGYATDDTTVHKVTVSTNAKCSDTTYVGQSITFKDTPKTNLTVHAESQVAGGTKSRISCTNNSGGALIGNSPQPADTPGPPVVQNFADPVTVTATGLAPGNYTCVVVIDP